MDPRLCSRATRFRRKRVEFHLELNSLEVPIYAFTRIYVIYIVFNEKLFYKGLKEDSF